MKSRRPGKVHVLRLEPPDQASLLERDGEWITNRVKRGATVTRYKREWLVGKVELDGAILAGRIGFRGSEGTAEVWNDQDQDFEAIAVPQGQAVPFAIDLDGLKIAIQTRPQLKLNGLIGAIEALLSEDRFRWRVRSTRAELTFAQWRASVERVTRVRLRVVRPNPHYRDTPNLEALLEQAEAEVVSMEIQSDLGIDTAAPFIEESQQHIDAGYGEAVYQGESEGHETVYNTKLQSEETYEEFDVTVEGEVPHESLRTALADQHSAGDDVVDDGDGV